MDQETTVYVEGKLGELRVYNKKSYESSVVNVHKRTRIVMIEAGVFV
jgi:hypothetical protein